MPTEKQLTANRLNAQKSTGPRTPEGKANSARNGPRHRRLMKAVVLTSESRQTFRAFQNWFHNEYQPSGPTQLMLLHVMVTAAWRLFRIWHVERAGIDYELDLQLGATPSGALADLDLRIRTQLAIRTLAGDKPPLEAWGRSEFRLDRQFRTALNQLLKLQAAMPEKDRPVRPSGPCPLSFDDLCRLSNPSATETDECFQQL